MGATISNETAKRPTALILASVWPEKKASAAGLRTWNWIDFFLQEGFEVHLASAASLPAHLEVDFAHLSCHSLTLNDSSFDTWIATWTPTLCLMDRFIVEEQFGWKIKQSSPHTLRWLDTQDVHFIRAFRKELFQTQPEKCFPLDKLPLTQASSLKAEHTLLRELASFYRSDYVWVLSDAEQTFLTQHLGFPSEKIGLTRLHYPSCPLVQELPSFEDRRHFCFIGNGRHLPNQDAVTLLKEKLWPPIRQKLPHAECHLYGAYPPAQWSAYHEPAQGFWVKGPTPDSSQTLQQYRVNLAPLRFGAGIKGKITDGWWSGTPALASPIAAEGMSEALPWGGLLLDSWSPSCWAQAAEKLYTEATTWKVAQQRGFDLIKTLYCQTTEQLKLHQKLSQQQLSRSLLSSHTQTLSVQSYWIEKLLWHQSLRSTEYFSRWLELKAKKSINSL